MLTRENVTTVTAAEILDAYETSDYPEGWSIESDHFGGTGCHGAVLGVRITVRDDHGVVLREVTGEVTGELAEAIAGKFS